MSITLLLRKATGGRPGSQEKTGYVHAAQKISCTSWPPAKCMTILETRISIRLHRSTKNLKKIILINPYIYWVKYHSVPSQQQYLWPVATRKGQPVMNKHHCKYNPYICLFIFPFVLNHLHIITMLYIYIIWHLKCLYSFESSGSIMFTVHLHCSFHFCLLSNSLALAMLTDISHANKAPWIEFNWKKESGREREKKRR